MSAYVTAGIHTDHESGSLEELNERLRNGMYVMLRYGSACRELPMLLKGVNEQNSRRCILCADDLQPVTIFEKGDMDENFVYALKMELTLLQLCRWQLLMQRNVSTQMTGEPLHQTKSRYCFSG